MCTTTSILLRATTMSWHVLSWNTLIWSYRMTPFHSVIAAAWVLLSSILRLEGRAVKNWWRCQKRKMTNQPRDLAAPQASGLAFKFLDAQWLVSNGRWLMILEVFTASEYQLAWNPWKMMHFIDYSPVDVANSINVTPYFWGGLIFNMAHGL